MLIGISENNSLLAFIFVMIVYLTNKLVQIMLLSSTDKSFQWQQGCNHCLDLRLLSALFHLHTLQQIYNNSEYRPAVCRSEPDRLTLKLYDVRRFVAVDHVK